MVRILSAVLVAVVAMACSPAQDRRETSTSPVVSVASAQPVATALPPEPVGLSPRGELGEVVQVDATETSPSVEARALVWRARPDEKLTMALRFGAPVVAQAESRAFGDSDAALAKIEVELTGPNGAVQKRSATFRTAPRDAAVVFWPARTLFIEIAATGVSTSWPKRASAPWSEGELQRVDHGTWHARVVSHIHLPKLGQTWKLASGRVAFDVQPHHPARREMMLAAEPERVKAGASSQHEPSVEAGFVADTLIQLDDDRWVARFAKPAVWAFQLTSVMLSRHAKVTGVETLDISTCIAASMRIDTPTGPRPVEELAPGDMVWGWSFERGERVATPVLGTVAFPGRATVWLGDLQLSPVHPVWSEGSWRMAGEIAGARPGGDATVYALTVAEPHTFFAEGVLVHNKDRNYSDNLDDPWVFMWSPKEEWFK